MIERAGGMDSDGLDHEIDADGGEYWAGAQHLLFLKWQGGRSGATYLINDAARYEVEGRKLVAVDSGDPVGRRFHGKLVERVLNLLEDWKE